MKNGARKRPNDLRPEYDLRQLKGGVRGKYFARESAGTTPVVLEPDVAETFPTSQAVNEALRALAKVAQSHARIREVERPLQPKSRKRASVKKVRELPQRSLTIRLQPVVLRASLMRRGGDADVAYLHSGGR